jgi:CRP/FNR family cyclic AMP-dependent transcriptional regulator
MSPAVDNAPLPRDFAMGELLFREGERGDQMFVIQKGSVVVSKNIDGTPTTLAELNEGDFVGEIAVVNGGTHTTSATATTPTRVLVIDGATLEDMVTEDSEIAVRFIRGLANRLAVSHDMLALVGARDSRMRVCMAIVRHAEASTDQRPDGVWIPKRLGDIGDEVAVGATELGEIAKQFLKLKLVRVKRDGILVPDVSRLYEFVKSIDV